MDTRTGQILEMEEVLKKPIKEQKWFKEIPEEDVEKLQPMNRKQRREYYKKHKGDWK